MQKELNDSKADLFLARNTPLLDQITVELQKMHGYFRNDLADITRLEGEKKALEQQVADMEKELEECRKKNAEIEKQKKATITEVATRKD